MSATTNFFNRMVEGYAEEPNHLAESIRYPSMASNTIQGFPNTNDTISATTTIFTSDSFERYEEQSRLQEDIERLRASIEEQSERMRVNLGGHGGTLTEELLRETMRGMPEQNPSEVFVEDVVHRSKPWIGPEGILYCKEIKISDGLQMLIKKCEKDE